MTARHLPYADYDAIPAVRSSRLKLMAKSPKHYRYQEDVDTNNRAFLRAVHAAALELETFSQVYAQYEGGGSRRTNEYKAFCAANPGKTVLSPSEWGKIRDINASMRLHPVAGPLLFAPGRCEESLTWSHPGTGLLCKARLDKRLVPGLYDEHVIVDIKTYGTSNPRIIGNRVAALGAHLQAAHYVEGVSIVHGIPRESIRYLLIVAESASPFDVAVVELAHDGGLALGVSERERLMAQIAECTASGVWPGACPELVPLVLPPWADPYLQDGEIAESKPNPEEDF